MASETRPSYHRATEKYECRSSRYMSIGGKRIHYCVEGRGPTLLLLHGVMASLHTWQGWVDQLSSHYRIVRIDVPGFGLSEHLASDDYTPEHALELIDQVCDRLHLREFSIAGSSLGAFFAWWYAANRPERVEKLILIAPIGYPQKLPSLISFVSLPLVGELARYVSPRALVDRNVRAVYGDPTRVSEDLVDRYHALLLHGRNRMAMVQSFRRLREYNEDGELWRHVQRVRAPTLLMWGQEDRWVPVSLLEGWRRDLPNAQTKVYAGVGHLPMEEIPELTALDAHAFLSGGEGLQWDDHGTDNQQTVVPFQYARGA
jgi:pimeloyl-ACP methyl ester carboxylesterase